MARNRGQILSVPIGGGINRAADPDLLAPPFASVAENVVTRQAGGYQKLPGGAVDLAKDGVSGVSATDSGILFPTGRGGLAYAGQAVGRLRTLSAGWDTVAEDHMMAHPLRVSWTPVLSLPGEVAQPAVCHNSGYTAIACRHRTNAGLAALESHTVWAIVDSEGEVVGGPWVSTGVKEYPRIEAIDISGSPGFVFIGLSKAIDGTLDPFPIVARRIDTANLPDPGTLTISGAVGTLTPPTTSHGMTARLLYDTAGHPEHNRCYVVFYNGTNTVCVRTDGTNIGSPVTVFAGDKAGWAVHYDLASSTVLVADSSGNIFYDDPLLGGFASVSGGITPDHPVWYYSAAEGNLYMDGMDVNLTGSNPGTPSFTGSRAHTPAGKVYDPQGFADTIRGVSGCTFFRGGSLSSIGTDAGHSWLDATYLNSDSEHFALVPLQETLLPETIWEGVSQNDLSPALFVQPQASNDPDGRIYVPSIRPISASRGVSAGYVIGSAGDEGDTGGFDVYKPNHDRLVGFTTIDPQQEALLHSVIQHQDTTILAAGNVGAWDGENYFDFLSAPEIVRYDDDSSSGLPVGGDRSDIGQTDDQHIDDNTGAVYYEHVKWWAMKVVLVFTDRNGIEWRSAPSPARTQESIDGAPSDPVPIVELSLDDSHRRILKRLQQDGDGTSFDVEFYVTARDDGGFFPMETDSGGATEADIIEEYYLAYRGPLYMETVSSVDRYYFYDPLLSAFQGGVATGYQSVPLYTDANELAPIRPPASHLVAAAANYLFLVPSEFPWELWPTKPLERGRAPEWAPEIIIGGPPGGGRIVSLAGQGDRLILLCERGVWELFVGGSGPDANGQGGFGAFRNVHQGDGCVSHRGTVSTPVGVIYLSGSGPKLVGGDGGIQDIGAALTGLFDPADILCSCYHESAREVWLSFSTGTAILNLTTMAWTTCTTAYNFLVFQGGFLFKQNADGGEFSYESSLLPESSTWPLDGGDDLKARIVTPWLTFDGPTRWHRTRLVAVHGRSFEVGTQGAIRISFAYDYVNSEVESYIIAGSDWDDDARKEIKPARQKYDAIRITVEEVGGEEDVSHLVWALSSLTLQVESKSGNAKLAYVPASSHTTS